MIKIKKLLVILCAILILTGVFAMTAYAAPTGDVAGAIEGTWNTASVQIKTVVNKVVWRYSSLQNSEWHTSTIESMGSLNGRRQQYYLRALCSCLRRPSISGKFSECRRKWI